MASAEILYGVVNCHIGAKHPPCGKMRHTKPKCQRPQKGRIFAFILGRGAFVGGTVGSLPHLSEAETRPQATGLHRKPLWPKATDAFSLIHLELFLIQTERLRFDLLTYGALSNRV